MTRRSRTRGAGFSLYEMKDVLSDCTDKIAEVLGSQGVNVDVDQLFLELQLLSKRVGSGNSGYGFGAVPGAMVASEAPYSFSGDLLSVAYDNFQSGNKKEALRCALLAMEGDDFGNLVAAILKMNSQSNIQREVTAENSSDDDEDADAEIIEEEIIEEEIPADEDEEIEDDEEEEFADEEDDLSDDELDEIVADVEEDQILKELEKDDDTSRPEDDEADTDEEEEDEENHPGVPMGKSTSHRNALKNPPEPKKPQPSSENKPSLPKMPTQPQQPQQPIQASITSRTLANKLSLSGDNNARKKARDFVKNNPRL